MMVASWVMTIMLLMLIGVFGGMLVLQWYLSRRENEFLGFILPGLCFLGSLLEMILVQPDFGRFLVANISTAVLFAIYIVVREGKKKQRELEEMKIRDL